MVSVMSPASLIRRAAAEIDNASVDDAMPLSAACRTWGADALSRIADLALQLRGSFGFLRGTWPEQSHRDVRAF